VSTVLYSIIHISVTIRRAGHAVVY